MVTTSLGSKLLSGLTSITAEKVGEKVGLKLITNLLSEPAEFFLEKGLAALFGTAESEDFREVFEKLDEIEKEIEDAVGTISVTVQEAELEEQHARLSTYFSNLRTAAISSSNLTSGFEGAYTSFFANDVVEVLDHINRDTQEVNDTLIGSGAVSQAYLDLLVQGLYSSNTEMSQFSTRLSAIGTLYITDLLHSTLVLQCIGLHATDSLHKAKAAELIQEIGGYCQAISDRIHQHLRDIKEIADNTGSVTLKIHNQASGKVLGRYAETKVQDRSIITHFEMQDMGAGYYYLKVAGKDVGIDHYDGKRIEPVRKGRSTHPNHLWKFDPAPSQPTRLFRVVNKATGAALDHYYGRSIKSAPNDEHPNHLWEILPHVDGVTCCIVNHATGALLGYDISHGRIDAFSGHFVIDAGVDSTSFPLSSSLENGRWHLVQNGNEPYFNLVNQQCGQTIDHYDGKSLRFVTSPSSHPNHLWRFEPTVVGEQNADYFIRNKATQQVLDHYYGKSLEGASDTAASSPHPNHIWSLERI